MGVIFIGVDDALHELKRIIYFTVFKDYLILAFRLSEILVVLRSIGVKGALPGGNLPVVRTLWNVERGHWIRGRGLRVVL